MYINTILLTISCIYTIHTIATGMPLTSNNPYISKLTVAMDVFKAICILLCVTHCLASDCDYAGSVTLTQEVPLDRAQAVHTDGGYAEHTCTIVVPSDDLRELIWTVIDNGTPSDVYKYENDQGNILESSLVQEAANPNVFTSTGGRSTIMVKETLDNNFIIKCKVNTNSFYTCSDEKSTTFSNPPIEIFNGADKIMYISDGGHCNLDKLGEGWNGMTADLTCKTKYVLEVATMTFTGDNAGIAFSEVATATSHSGSYWQLEAGHSSAVLRQQDTITCSVNDAKGEATTLTCTLPGEPISLNITFNKVRINDTEKEYASAMSDPADPLSAAVMVEVRTVLDRILPEISGYVSYQMTGITEGSIVASYDLITVYPNPPSEEDVKASILSFMREQGCDTDTDRCDIDNLIGIHVVIAVTCLVDVPGSEETVKKQIGFGETVAITCKDGYKPPTENQTPVCNKHGQLDPVPSCTVVACQLPPLQNTIYSSTNAVYGDTIQVHCDDGYTRKGPEYVTCGLNGRLSPFPQCEVVTCSVKMPNSIPNKDTSDTIDFGEKVKYTCKEGFIPTGDQTAECGADGNLVPEPSCTYETQTRKGVSPSPIS